VTSTSARLRTARTGTALAPGPGRTGRVSLAWPRLPAAVEVAIIVIGYLGYALVRLAVKASRTSAFAHAAQLWQAEHALHIDIEPSLNHLTAASPALAEAAGYYYGLLNFIITPLVLAWLYLRRPAAFGPLRSALVLSTTAANLVFWTWPAAPPRFAVPGMTDVLDRYHILGSGDPHGPDSLVNLYAAMPSLHVAWAAWCAAAVVVATRGRWRHLAWLYPAATTFVVLASANHFVLDVAAGLAVMTLGLLAARGIPVTGWHGIRTRFGRRAAGATTRPDATGPVAGGAVPAPVSPAMGPGAAPRDRRPVIWWRGLARRWAWAVTGGRRRGR
jgi:PAP2 superfamily